MPRTYANPGAVAAMEWKLKSWLGFIPTPADWNGVQLDLEVHCVNYIPSNCVERERGGASPWLFLTPETISQMTLKHEVM